MKQVFFLGISYLFLMAARSQNVGLNTTNPTRAKLEVVGVDGGGNTSGIFGLSGAGISVQQNMPAIGFNQYRDENIQGYQGKFMTNGFAALQYLDPATGVFTIEMFANGTKSNYTPIGVKALTFTPTGNTGIKYPDPVGTLSVAKDAGSTEATAVFMGTNYASMFHYLANEDIYIRPGKDSSKVFFCAQNLGDLLIGGGQAKLFINRKNISGTTSTLEITQDYFDLLDSPPLGLVDANGKTWGNYLDLNGGSVSAGNPAYDFGFVYGGTLKSVITSLSGNYFAYSDKRLKTGVRPLGPVLAKLGALKPVSYEVERDNPGHRRSIGFIAQDVKKVFPDAVRVISDQRRNGMQTNDLHTMTYKNFGIYAIKALQEQWQQIEMLKQEQALLEKELDELLQKAQAYKGL